MVQNIFILLIFGLSALAGMNRAQVVSFSDGHLADKARILIVPGHEPDYGGAEYYSTRERDLVAELGRYLAEFLKADPYYNVTITRDERAWNPIFADYFQTNWDQIITWEKTYRQNGTRQKAREATTSPIIDHIRVPAGVALRLYGITKWANDNATDLVIHLHLNDAPDRRKWSPGRYSGIVIYTPAGLYANSSTTMAVANSVLKRLSTYNPISDLPGETGGIIADPELIAIGANNTADAASLLVEYDYIYQPQFTNSKLRSLTLKDLAYQTYLGLQDFFRANNGVTTTPAYVPSIIYKWNDPVKNKGSDPKDIYALQTALQLDGDYPPAGTTKNECPHTGFLGTCTKNSVKLFQKKYGIIGENIGGQKTFELLRNIYNGQ